jgi:hypothetical protein
VYELEEDVGDMPVRAELPFQQQGRTWAYELEEVST